MATTIINLSSLDGTNGFRLDGVAANQLSGASVSNAGDVDGDGFDDVIIGAPDASPNGKNSGASYVVFGKASGFSATMSLSTLNGGNGFRLEGSAAGDRLGSVCNAGDVNGDGLDDLIIGAPGADSNGSNSGSSYVVFGKDTGFEATMNLSSLDGNNGFRLDGPASDLMKLGSGAPVSSAGDINGDGFDDVIIGASSQGNDDYSSPVTVDYVVFGKAPGFDSISNLSDLNGSNGFRLQLATIAETTSVSSAGDINGDGYDDLIVGILLPSTYRDAINGTVSYVVFGKGSGFDSAINLFNLDGSDGFKLTGMGFNLYGGALDVSNAGDINGDGFGDLIIGAAEEFRAGYDSGTSYVVFGKASGFDATMSLSDLDGDNGFRIDGVTENDRSGSSVSGAGDVNGDGFDDLIVGAPGAPNSNGDRSGSSYVVFGKASGFDATMSLSDLDGDNGFRIDGVTENDRSGSSVSGAADVNGDGFDDLIVGAPGVNLNGENSNASFVIFGRSDFTGGSDVDFPGTPGNDIFTGTSAAESFVGGAGNDRMIGRGGADSFDGGAGNDYIRILGDNFQFVDGGLGTDILGLAGSGFNLDLSGVIDNIHGIEIIALYGVGDNTLTLTAQDVIDLSGETNTLKIKGNVGDSVVGLSNGWVDGGIRGNFHEYTQGDAVVLIGVNVTTDFPVG